MSKKLLRLARPWLVAAGLIVLWEAGCYVFSVPIFVLPKPSQVMAAIFEFRAPLLSNSVQTLVTTLVGFAIAVVVGVLLGVAIGTSVVVYEALYPTLIAFNAIPKVALVPVIVIWCGIGTIPAIITAATIAFFPIAVNVATGLATVEPEIRDVLRSLGATRYEMLSKVGVPRSLPYLFASLKIAITLAFVGSVISETVAANAGIGFLMLSASANFQVPLVFAGLFVLAVMSVVIYALCAIFERRMTGWAFRGQLIS
jgi:NitT/TauT family transport system permease protein